ncbi:MAG: putative membrane protein YhiD involved in acid resistance [Alteromonadaceae bacterium]|jgi:uncharacterized membrane protein YhiD involved in acid resistance
MSLVFITWLLGALLIFTLVVLIVLSKQNKNLKISNTNINHSMQTNDILIMQIQSSLADLSANMQQQKSVNIEQQNDNVQVSKQLEYRIKTLQQQIAQQQQVFEQFQNQQPEDKLYSRAFKLAELGADIEEIMRECDIPRAEAEMLMSMHHKRKK